MGSAQRSVPLRVRRIGKGLLGRRIAARRQRPQTLRRLAGEYEVGNLLLEAGRVPVRWWCKADNFGDLMSPWLIAKMTGREVAWTDSSPHYLAIGSVLNTSNPNSLVWGAGAFGVENGQRFCADATYTAVRGPLSRARLVARDIPCPEVYGDPALLAPAYFAPQVKKSHKYGIVTRWSDRTWHQAKIGDGVRLIDLASDDVEGVIEAMLTCRRIVTGSLHGLIIADAYGIPSAWVRSRTTYGGPYKFFDYFATVGKLRMFQEFDTSMPVTANRLHNSLVFDGRPIDFDYRALLDACPFLQRVDRASARPQRRDLPAAPEREEETPGSSTCEPSLVSDVGRGSGIASAGDLSLVRGGGVPRRGGHPTSAARGTDRP
ncbi:MAG TPA: polysaccharide pyruvyl transferase family protein [Nocardioides sp.]|nr:polysaccharide pyruvyl transferase family protein [Nocardioides sp.]